MGKIQLGGYTLCMPTYVYIIFSFITFIMLIASDITAVQLMWFIIKVLIWVFLLNLMCANGLIPLAWFFVLLPFFIIFILLVSNNVQDYSKVNAQLNNKQNMPQMPDMPQMPQMLQK
jgi:hypothetical protein